MSSENANSGVVSDGGFAPKAGIGHANNIIANRPAMAARLVLVHILASSEWEVIREELLPYRSFGFYLRATFLIRAEFGDFGGPSRYPRQVTSNT